MSTGTAPALRRSFAANGSALLIAFAVALLGLAPLGLSDSYSWVEYGTSESGAQGVEGAWIARLGFLSFGLGVFTLAQLRAKSWGLIGALLHGLFGVSMLGVAAFSARSWDEAAPYVSSEDALHSLFAGLVGFGFIAGMVAVMVFRHYESAVAAIPEIVPLAIASVTPMLMSTGIWGALQRVMFLAAAAWYVREASLHRETTQAVVPTTSNRNEGPHHEHELHH